MRISDWSSDVCSSDLIHSIVRPLGGALLALALVDSSDPAWQVTAFLLGGGGALLNHGAKATTRAVVNVSPEPFSNAVVSTGEDVATGGLLALAIAFPPLAIRSEEHTSELQSLMRISYAVFCLKKKTL